jgi:hypothetical protein
MSTAYRDDTARLDVHRKVASALMTAADQGAEFSILGVAEPIDPLEVADNMLEGVDVDGFPNWGRIVDLTVAGEAGKDDRRRAVFLSVKLSAPGGWAALATALRAAESLLGADLGLTASPVTKRERTTRTAEATALARRLTNILGQPVVPASASTVTWLHERAALRGIEHLPAPRCHSVSVTAGQLMAIADRTKIFEGGQDGDPGRKVWGNHHYAKVVTEVPRTGELAVGYQAAAVVSAHPSEWDHPGGTGDWLARLDELGALVDWCARVQVNTDEHALGKIRRKRYEATAQVDEHDSNVGSSLAAAAVDAIHGLNHQEAYLRANPAEHDLSVTTIVALSAPSVGALRDDFFEVADHFKTDGYTFDRPLGHQSALLACMQPGSAPHGVLGHFGQSMFCAGLATASPFESADLLDPYGILVGDKWDGAEPCGPVFLDPAFGPRHDRGSSMCFLGDQGGGKSYAGKLITFGNLARGGKGVALDRTQMEEYVRFARAIPKMLPGVSSQVVRLDDPRVCVDPLQVFSRDVDTGEDLRRKYALGLASVMLNIETMSEEYMALARAVDAVLRRPDPNMGAVLVAIRAAANSPAGTEEARSATAAVAGKLTALASDPLGRLIFGDGEPLDLSSADYIVFAARHLDLPTEDQLSKPHLYRKLAPEKILAQGLLYLITAISREFAYADDGRMCVCTFDEVWALTNSPEGADLLQDLLRNGRKHKACVIVLSQDGADVAALKGISYWFVFLQIDEEAARRALKCVGLPATGELVDMITSPAEMGNGVCLARDLARRAGRIRFREALTAELKVALETNADRLAALEPPKPRVAARAVAAASPTPRAAPRVTAASMAPSAHRVRPSKRRAG